MIQEHSGRLLAVSGPSDKACQYLVLYLISSGMTCPGLVHKQYESYRGTVVGT